MAFRLTSKIFEKYGDQFWYKNPENYGHRLYKLPDPSKKTASHGGGDYYEMLYKAIRSKVVPLQDCFDMIDIATGPFVAMMCICRKRTRATEENSLREYSCLGVGSAQLKWKRWMERYRGGIEFLSPFQAKEWLDHWDAQGMVHIIMGEGTGSIAGICNCDYPDCIAIRMRLDYDIAGMCIKAEYVAKINYNRCIGCGDCIRRCQFGAMKNEITIKRTSIDPYRCFGCGVCQRVCEQKAIDLHLRRSFPALREEW
jgi:ferredoxin